MKRRILAMLLIAAMLCTASAVCAEELQTLTNPYITAWGQLYTEALNIEKMTDMALFSEPKIHYADSGVRNGLKTGASGAVVANGGVHSQKETFTVGMGAGVDNPELWYVSFVFTGKTSEQDLVYTVAAMLIGCHAVGLDLSTGDGEYEEHVMQVLEKLLSGKRPLMIEANGLVLVAKDLGDGQQLFAVDSLAYFDDFYYSDRSNPEVSYYKIN
ncbi:MAG: hypothetical protein PHY12_13010 [Eubacteriales bacterium]|nr:hypothetical protein [Eubacteriales bacterium]